MIIIENINGNIEAALKKLKYKFNKLKISKELNDRKNFKKKSIVKREQKIKAKYKQRKSDDNLQ